MFGSTSYASAPLAGGKPHGALSDSISEPTTALAVVSVQTGQTGEAQEMASAQVVSQAISQEHAATDEQASSSATDSVSQSFFVQVEATESSSAAAHASTDLSPASTLRDVVEAAGLSEASDAAALYFSNTVATAQALDAASVVVRRKFSAVATRHRVSYPTRGVRTNYVQKVKRG